jgi:hypothetical protein
VRPLADEHIGFVLERAGVVGIGALELGQEERDVLGMSSRRGSE